MSIKIAGMWNLAWNTSIKEVDDKGDWNTFGFIAPKDNNNSSATPSYIPDTDNTAQFWFLKKNVTNGYTQTTVSSTNALLNKRRFISIMQQNL
jgi:hypothetical protein